MNEKELLRSVPVANDANIPAVMSAQRNAAIAALIAAGEVTSFQHARFMAAAGLISLPD
jgi:hypothetical protein